MRSLRMPGTEYNKCIYIMAFGGKPVITVILESKYILSDISHTKWNYWKIKSMFCFNRSNI